MTLRLPVLISTVTAMPGTSRISEPFTPIVGRSMATRVAYTSPRFSSLMASSETEHLHSANTQLSNTDRGLERILGKHQGRNASGYRNTAEDRVDSSNCIFD